MNDRVQHFLYKSRINGLAVETNLTRYAAHSFNRIYNDARHAFNIVNDTKNLF
jgi:hypothetical protein